MGAIIRKGSFAIPTKEGPVPGRYRVRIYASSPGVAGRPRLKARPIVSLAPMVRWTLYTARYNSQTELIADVRARRTNRLSFSLNSGRSAGAPVDQSKRSWLPLCATPTRHEQFPNRDQEPNS